MDRYEEGKRSRYGVAPFMDVKHHCPPQNIHNSHLDVKTSGGTALPTISKTPPQFPQKYPLHPQPFTLKRKREHPPTADRAPGGGGGEGKLDSRTVLIQGNKPTKSNHHPPIHPTFTTPSSSPYLIFRTAAACARSALKSAGFSWKSMVLLVEAIWPYIWTYSCARASFAAS